MTKFASRPHTANIGAAWLVQQFITDGEVGAVYHGLIDSLELQDSTPMPQVTVSSFFADFTQFQDRFINKELHG
eukprot:jgi/Tetstr1/443333/TSEL_031348.t1